MVNAKKKKNVKKRNVERMLLLPTKPYLTLTKAVYQYVWQSEQAWSRVDSSVFASVFARYSQTPLVISCIRRVISLDRPLSAAQEADICLFAWKSLYAHTRDSGCSTIVKLYLISAD